MRYEPLKGKEKLFLKESVIKLATLINNKSINSLIFLNYCPELEKFVFWAQQLIAESLGKKGKGINPTVSIGPKDHHSLLQLYLEGPKDKFFTFFSSPATSSKKIETIVNAQCKATKNIFRKKKIPYRQFFLKKNDESELGSIFTFFVTSCNYKSFYTYFSFGVLVNKRN